MIQTDQISKNGDYRNSNEVAQQFASLPLTWPHSSNAAFVVTDIIGYLVDSSKVIFDKFYFSKPNSSF